MQDVPEFFLDQIEQSGTAAVWVNAKLDHNAVHPDDAEGVRTIVERLLELGHRRVVYLGRDAAFSKHYSVRDRADAYALVMRRAGLSPVFQAVENQGSGACRREAIKELLARRPAPSAVVCETTLLANPLLHAAVVSGLRVPDDLTIASVIDGPHNLLDVPLGGVELPFRDIGRIAAQMLVERVAQRTPQPTRCLPLDFHLGATIASPSI